MTQLTIDHREIQLMFMSGHFIVHQINGSFNAVSPDMKLKQIIQRFQKTSMVLLARQENQSLIMLSPPLLVQVLDHVSYTSIMN